MIAAHDGPVTTPDPHRQIRIGTSEREAAIGALGEHMAAGRLEPDEYGDRVASASSARFRDELDALFADLPAPHPFAQTPPRPAQPPRTDRSWERYVPASPFLRVALGVAATVLLLSVLPFVAAAAVLWFFVLPALTCGGPWHRYGLRMWRGPVRRW